MPKNIFISRPTVIQSQFLVEYDAFETYLAKRQLKAKRLGASDFTLGTPLSGVIDLMKKCKAAIILGYPQYEIRATLLKSTSTEKEITQFFPTPWNQIEATLAFQQNIPVLVIAHNGISGGIFDHGVTGEYICAIDLSMKEWFMDKNIQGVFKEWMKRIQ